MFIFANDRSWSTVPAQQYFVVGGIHMTGNSFVPTTLLKDLTATEYSGELDFNVLKQMTLEDFNALQVLLKEIFWILVSI